MNTEMKKLTEYRQISDQMIRQALRRDHVPWRGCAGPSTWQQVYNKPPYPVYTLEIDTRQISAGKLMNHPHLLHDISTALGGTRVRWKNHIGLGLVFDERPAPQFPDRIPLPKPPGKDYLIPLGVDLEGCGQWPSIRQTKNIVIAGSTQFGKITGLRSWLAALTAQHSPQNLQLALVDGKDFELVGYEGSPWLPDFMHGQVATEIEAIQSVTAALVKQVEQRRRLFKKHRVGTVAALKEKTGQPLPVIILVVDEVRDLIDAGLDTTNIFRIAQQGVGVDIFVVLGTQRPDAETVNKSNFATTVAYRLANTAESQVVFTTHEPYHTLKQASPGELVVLGLELDYFHLKGFWPPEAETPGPAQEETEALSRLDRSHSRSKFHIQTPRGSTSALIKETRLQIFWIAWLRKLARR